MALSKSFNLSKLQFFSQENKKRINDTNQVPLDFCESKEDNTLKVVTHKNVGLHWCSQWITHKVMYHWIFLKWCISVYSPETHEEGREDPVPLYHGESFGKQQIVEDSNLSLYREGTRGAPRKFQERPRPVPFPITGESQECYMISKTTVYFKHAHLTQ